ncbi:response regulator [bacterium]|nr:response regulator [bacterium]
MNWADSKNQSSPQLDSLLKIAESLPVILLNVAPMNAEGAQSSPPGPPLLSCEGGDVRALLDISTRLVQRSLDLQGVGRSGLDDCLRDSDHGLMEYFPDGIVLRSPAGIEKCNSRFEEMFGYSEDDLRDPGFDLLNLADSSARGTLHALLEGEHPENSGVDSRVFLGRTREGQPLHVELRTRRCTSEHSGTEILIFQDVSKLVHLEQQVRQSEKLESVGTLTSGISHDFNNILTVISGVSELAMQRMEELDPSRHEFSLVLEAVHRASNLTRKLLSFARARPDRMDVISVDDVVCEMTELLERSIGADIQLTIDSESPEARVYANGHLLEQVLLNLCTNARDALPQGGQITIRTEVFATAEPYPLFDSVLPPGSFLRLSVRDTGSGIPSDILDNIFEPFFTTKEEGRGTGLGLATVQKIINQHQGYLDVITQEGEGTEFALYFPLAQSNGHRNGHVHPTGKSLHAKGGVVIVVDDNESLLRVIAKLLKRYGYQVHEFSDAAELTESGSTLFHIADVLITDVVMPGITGLELIDHARAVNPDIGVLCMTGYDNQTLREKDLYRNDLDYFPKPFTKDQLAQAVNSVLEKRETVP